MNTDPNRLREIEPTPEQKAPYFSQAGFQAWAVPPSELSGLYVLAYRGPDIVACYGPFVGMCAIEQWMFAIFRALFTVGADAWEIVRKE
jgi:hypothetical protein